MYRYDTIQYNSIKHVITTVKVIVLIFLRINFNDIYIVLFSCLKQDPVILRGVQCLEIQQVPVGDMYTQSLMAYAYTMWNRNETKRTEIMNVLEARAIKTGKMADI